MGDFKGTPGVWGVGMNGEIISDAGYVVMSTDLVHGNEHDLDLVSSAPELLDALQDALYAHDKHGEYSEWDFARAAIAKALGK